MQNFESIQPGVKGNYFGSKEEGRTVGQRLRSAADKASSGISNTFNTANNLTTQFRGKAGEVIIGFGNFVTFSLSKLTGSDPLWSSEPGLDE